MYHIKPVYNSQHLLADLPTSMYKMKPIYANSPTKSATASNGVVSDNNAADALQTRQLAIIEQLKDLKTKLALMHKQLGVSASTAQPSNTNKSSSDRVSTSVRAPVGELKPIDGKYLQDVVINAHPKNIPFSLVALQKIWQHRLNLNIKCYTHSTVAALPDQNQHFAKQLNSLPVNPQLPTLNISLIWKEVGPTELICAPATFVTIVGESNVLRYLSRVGPKEFNDDSFDTDAVLDLCHQLFIFDKNAKNERLPVLRALSVKLGERNYFGGENFAISDIVVSSAFRQMVVSSKDIAPNLSTWVKRVSALF